MLGAYGLWAGRDLRLATSVMNFGLHFLTRKTTPRCGLWRQTRDWEDMFLVGSAIKNQQLSGVLILKLCPSSTVLEHNWLRNIALIWRGHQYQRRATSEVRHMFGFYRFWALKDLYHATPADTLGPRSEGPTQFSRSVRQARDSEDLILPGSHGEFWWWFQISFTSCPISDLWRNTSTSQFFCAKTVRTTLDLRESGPHVEE